MIGNNLERDIAGANRLGLRSVFFHPNERRRTIPQSRAEMPRHTVTNAGELLDLIHWLSIETTGSQVPEYQDADADLDIAARYAPWILFDQAEPFFPALVGYTIFRSEGQSPSFLRRIERGWRPEWSMVIEYAIWWDWDIGHLYELEHVWSYVDPAGKLVWVEASSHGAYASMLKEDRTIPHEGRHPVVVSQPGKHAFSPVSHWFEMFRDMVCAAANDRAGSGGVLVKPEYERQVPKNPDMDTKVKTWLQQKAFQPTFQFTKLFKVTRQNLVPWPVLDVWIPERVNWWLSQL
jgi:hypothetical protein